MLDIFSLIGKGLVTLSVAVASFVGIVPQNVQAPVNLSGTFQTPEVKALFTTSLASKITSSATSMTLVSATDKDGNTLASSTYGFIIDEGTSVEEFVLADCTGTVCTNMTRGISVATATSSVAALQFEHRRGASVKITTAPSLVFVMNALKGKQNLENVLRYDSTVATTTIDDDNRNLVNYELLAYTAFNGAGVINATASAKGVVELATQLETASSSALGSSGATVVIPAANATSTYNSATAALRVVTTQNNGKIDPGFVASSTLFSVSGNAYFATTTVTGLSNIASTTIYATTTTGTWVKPSNLRYMIVEVQGGGGSGFSVSSDGTSGGGGGGGGYAKKLLLASQVGATETVTVGGIAGTSSFGSHVSATGGTTATSNVGAVGGIGSGGDINIQGESGGTQWGNASAPSISIGGDGGSSVLGRGGRGSINGNSGSDGEAGKLYGGGGGGAGSQGSAQNGGVGAAGIVIFTYVFY